MHADPALGAIPRAAPRPSRARSRPPPRRCSPAARPLSICGGGPVIAGAEAELQALAELLEAPVATTISGQGSIAEDHPLALGVVGSNGGTPETRALVDRADLVVFVGCRAGSVTTERWRHPAPGKVRVRAYRRRSGGDRGQLPDRGRRGRRCPAGAARRSATRSRAVATRRAARASDASGGAGARPRSSPRFEALARSDDGADPARAHRRHAAGAAAARMRWSSPTPARRARTSRPTTSRAGPAASSSPTGRTARSATRCRRRSARNRPAGGQVRRGDGRRQLRLRLGRAGDHRAPAACRSPWWWSRTPPSAGSRPGRRAASAGAISRSISRPASTRASPRPTASRAWRVEDPADLRPALAAALEAGGPALVDVVTQPLHEAQAPVSEWVA